MTKNEFLNAIQNYLNVMDKGDVSNLMTRWGYYRQSVTPELIYQARIDNGSAFGVEFAQLLQETFQSEKDAVIVGLLNATGTTSTSTGTTAAATSTGSILLGILDFLVDGTDAAKDMYDSIVGTTDTIAQANLTASQAALAKVQQTEKLRTLAVVGGVIVILIIAVVIIFKK